MMMTTNLHLLLRLKIRLYLHSPCVLSGRYNNNLTIYLLYIQYKSNSKQCFFNMNTSNMIL